MLTWPKDRNRCNIKKSKFELIVRDKYGVSIPFRTSLTILIVIKKLGYDKDINKDHKLNDTIINIK